MHAEAVVVLYILVLLQFSINNELRFNLSEGLPSSSYGWLRFT